MDYALYLRALVTLVFVLGLMVVCLWALRRFNLVATAGVTRGGKPRRLGIVETLPLDPRRRLILIRRDGVEHLVLVSAGGETVIETGIPAPLPPVQVE